MPARPVGKATITINTRFQLYDAGKLTAFLALNKECETVNVCATSKALSICNSFIVTPNNTRVNKVNGIKTK